MLPRRQVCKCCVADCTNTSTEKPDLAFFTIPNDDRRDQWLRLISREDLRDVPVLSRSHRVCEEHFSRDLIIFTNTRKTLKRTALPARYLSSQESYTKNGNELHTARTSKNMTSKLTQTGRLVETTDWDKEIDSSKTSSTQELDENTSLFKNDRYKFFDLCDTFLTRDLSSLIKVNDGIRYKNKASDTDEYWQFCMNLYQTSPQTYNFFQKIYNMPLCSILLNHFVKTGTTINDSLMSTMKPRINKMSNKEKNCSVFIRTVDLKPHLCYHISQDKIYGFQEINEAQSAEPATMALVVMIRGLFMDWKQPIGYLLLHENDHGNLIQDWLRNLIIRLFDIGLNVRTLVSSIKDHWINESISEQPLCSETPFFFVTDRKIYHIFDAPDLMKSARDCMLLYDIHFQGKVAKFNDIVKFYKADQKRALPFAQNLTSSHIEPDDKEKQDPTYAIQLFSKIVANGLWNYMQFDFVKNAEIGTVEFIINMNNFFDALNISKQKSRGTDSERDVSEEDPQDALKEMLSMFQNLKVIETKNKQDVTLSVPFVTCIAITVKSILSLLADLKTEDYGIIPTKKLHLKSLDDFVKKLPSCAKNTSTILTTKSFRTAFRKLFILNLQKFTLEGSSKGEITNFLAQTSQLEEDIARNEDNPTVESLHSRIKISNPRSLKFIDLTKIRNNDYSIIDSSKRHTLMYIAGCLLFRAKKPHRLCPAFKTYLVCAVFEPSLDSGRFRKYNHYMQNRKDNMQLPAAACDNFVRFVEEMDEKFEKWFTNQHVMNQRIADSLYKDMEDINCELPCLCFPKTYVIKLFIRMKIFYTIRMNNMLFKTNKDSRKYFKIPRL